MVVLLMCRLPPPDQVSAALTCKTLFSIHRDALHESASLLQRDDKEDVLLRLERDLMATHLYCAICTRLHRFSRLNKPNEEPEMVLGDRTPECLGNNYPHSPEFANNHFGYHHGRAVMNRHFYGLSAGIDPISLRYGISWTTLEHESSYITWLGQFSVRVVQDCLFLVGKHTLTARNVPSLIMSLNSGLYDICPHTTTGDTSREMTLMERAVGLSPGDIPILLQEPGRTVHGSCRRCLTDYTVEVARIPRLWGFDTIYGVTVHTYHDFGSFRSPEDWKWKAWRSRIDDIWVKRRDTQTYSFGSVRQRFHDDEAGRERQQRKEA